MQWQRLRLKLVACKFTEGFLFIGWKCVAACFVCLLGSFIQSLDTTCAPSKYSLHSTHYTYHVKMLWNCFLVVVWFQLRSFTFSSIRKIYAHPIVYSKHYSHQTPSAICKRYSFTFATATCCVVNVFVEALLSRHCERATFAWFTQHILHNSMRAIYLKSSEVGLRWGEQIVFNHKWKHLFDFRFASIDFYIRSNLLLLKFSCQ